MAAALFATAVGCGVLALTYPSLERVWQVVAASPQLPAQPPQW
ncbi:hypothetical protein ACWCO0_33345 [Streptomyces tubercidicus]|nr:hypothetical protein [Streptomyces tubercidicus]WAU09979.1 hypothetical protein STRTU_000012 [Streptomyces tubercidicus]WAU16348.1 hypothetical protein STRTU_007160 [Streptomyces tubercidicus]